MPREKVLPLVMETDIVAWVGCEKDTRTVLENSTVMKELDKSLEKPTKAGKLTIRQPKEKAPNEEEPEPFLYWGNGTDTPGDWVVDQSNPIETFDFECFYMADNKAVSMAFGRDNCDGSWCNRCWKKWAQWQVLEKAGAGELITLEGLIDRHAKLKSGELDIDETDERRPGLPT